MILDKLIPIKFNIKDEVKGESGTCCIGGKTIEARKWDHLGNVTRWAVCDGTYVLNKRTKEYDYDGSNSSRTNRFIKTHRFSTLDEAYDAYLKAKKHEELMIIKH
jgi:hypothetical protein